jgi:hypothetical protein
MILSKAETVMKKIAAIPKRIVKPKTILELFGGTPAKSMQSYTYNDMSRFDNLMASGTGVPGN